MLAWCFHPCTINYTKYPCWKRTNNTRTKNSSFLGTTYIVPSIHVFVPASNTNCVQFPIATREKETSTVKEKRLDSEKFVNYFSRWYRSHRQEETSVKRVLSQSFLEYGLELPPLKQIKQEYCFYVEFSKTPTAEQEERLLWLIGDAFNQDSLSTTSSFPMDKSKVFVLEVGPRLNFQTAWSSNAVSICHSCGVDCVERIERSKRYFIEFAELEQLSWNSLQSVMHRFSSLMHDRMTEMIYTSPLNSFDTFVEIAKIETVPLIEKGIEALVEWNNQLGLGFDDWDMKYYYNMFVVDIGRNPTNVELFDIAQSNSEHSRHWFFKGRMFFNREEQPQCLLEMVQETWKKHPQPSVLAFADNSSSIRGEKCLMWSPERAGFPSRMIPNVQDIDITCTAETHNFPCGVAPFPGAETGTGGRIRDLSATGVGSLVIAGIAGYSVGNLYLPDDRLEWEDESFSYSNHLASPLKILIEASNGASDYGNKFGEPVICGFARTFGMRLFKGERREYIKPIMFSGGVGQMQHQHAEKGLPKNHLLVVKIGGPAYRIGMGGGAASSMVQGDNKEELDFNAVQRGDAEMEQKTYRVIRSCVELGKDNPIVSIHDQGAGGNCNVVKELIYPNGARIDIRKIWVGDKTLSVLEIWGAEYQEQYGLLLRPQCKSMFDDICQRENVVAAYIGAIDGSGKIVVFDSEQVAVDLELDKVLGKLPRKCFHDKQIERQLTPLKVEGCSLADWNDLPLGEKQLHFKKVLRKILRLMTVGSKAFLTNKVDRSVTGLVAQQQCVGPLQLPLADCAVVALSYFGTTGAVTAIGEQCIKTLISPAAMARMAVAEMLTNMAACKVSSLGNIRCEANWMWPAKMTGEGIAIYEAVASLRDTLIPLGIAVDGGKDSLSMASRVVSKEQEEMVKAPGTLVLTGYAFVPDIRMKVTPDIKMPGKSSILFLDLSNGKRRLGASAFAQVHGQLGDDCPDMENVELLKRAFQSIQSFIEEGLILSYHDISDGGLLIALLEMAMAGNCGLDIVFSQQSHSPFAFFFAEEVGMLIEVQDAQVEPLLLRLGEERIPCWIAATTTTDYQVYIQYNANLLIQQDIRDIRSIWGTTSFQLEKQQANVSCILEERRNKSLSKGPSYRTSFVPTPIDMANVSRRFKVAIIREEGTNGDRELAVAFHLAGFEVWDIHMRDLEKGTITLDSFSGIAFPGGFSFADVLDSSKGWAAVLRYVPHVRQQFQRFYERKNTFSLGVCNGCQLVAWLGWIPHIEEDSIQVRLVQNKSGRFESRFSTVKILSSPAIMLKDMEDSVLGIWCAHGEGQVIFPNSQTMSQVLSKGLAPIRYVNDDSQPTEAYPWNPNGSIQGIAALSSVDGRHLALMPHPERAIFPWQWSYYPENLPMTSPWMKMFQNAREWCEQNPSIS
eukprot:jgi/Galph1/3674/GphlegSOOS_G2371.1